MLDVRQIAREIVDREGGFVNDPDDPGGATKYGVTIGTARRVALDKDGDGDVDVSDLRALSREDAVRVFMEYYFQRPGIARLPEVLQASVFDMYVNAGANAVKILQRLLGQMGHRVDVDGAIGAQTVAASQAAAAAAPDHLADAYGTRGATIISDWPTSARPHANTRAAGRVARAAGSNAPKCSFRPVIT